jgi:GMP synthase (glutamine-hydrolysing)
VRVLNVVHQLDAPAGVFGEAVEAAGHELVHWLAPQSPPPSLDGIGAAMVFGGAMNVDEEQANPWLGAEKALLCELLERGVPTLGVCLGSQLVAEAAGARPCRVREPEIGWHAIELLPEAAGDPLLGPLPRGIEGFQWHSYEVPLPPGAVALARSPLCLQAFRLADRPIWGIQFHAEVTERAVAEWLDDYRSDADAVRIGIDPDAIRDETREKIAAWNELGRGIAERFAEAAQGIGVTNSRRSENDAVAPAVQSQAK